MEKSPDSRFAHSTPELKKPKPFRGPCRGHYPQNGLFVVCNLSTLKAVLSFSASVIRSALTATVRATVQYRLRCLVYLTIRNRNVDVVRYSTLTLS